MNILKGLEADQICDMLKAAQPYMIAMLAISDERRGFQGKHYKSIIRHVQAIMTTANRVCQGKVRPYFCILGPQDK